MQVVPINKLNRNGFQGNRELLVEETSNCSNVHSRGSTYFFGAQRM